ncbi:PEGA domain-containing protein, partial [bacterium]|nr:PEGA domain-containing protein [bacterium]
MSTRRIIPFSIFFLLTITFHSTAAEYREFQYTEVNSITTIFTNPSQSLLIVESTIPNLQFKSNRGILSQEEPTNGVYHLKLEPGVQLITIMADGFLPLELPRASYSPKGVKQIKVFPKPQFGSSSGFDENRPELNLNYKGQKESDNILVAIGNNPPQKIDFSNEQVILRPEPGNQTIRAWSEGKMWQSSLTLEVGQTYDVTIDFSQSTTNTLETVDDGNLSILTIPSGATIYLNQVKQEGQSPLDLKGLRPGIYTIEAVKELYLPTTQVVEVKPLEFPEITITLTPNFGYYQVKSNPPGAMISLNGRQRGRTPMPNPVEIDKGLYELRLMRDYYYEILDTFQIEPGVTFSREYELLPQFGSLEITSDPPLARVFVDNQLRGTTPLKLDTLFSGRHTISLELEHHHPQERRVQINDGKLEALHIDLASSVGYLRVTSDPSDARVEISEIDDMGSASEYQSIGKTPIDKLP